ncbi:MAG: biotin-dependent carboxyltransferase family protein [Dokdonella sp.]|uniref:5-oxoprolinase subunit C family protein n=1 Tax=Dokdonella sp. TaxID=2291710 RepID=UPI002CAC3AD0|nr:biotin-dependent carboxyltransferase family protein [Dokdonella sp.]HOX71237.1 biotin-dependent carboxyltransferase family protein [Dokdonella sp.]HPG95034.1 biotin-dependent carboxyltransferase family protein [Dokdonella sp.]HPN79037.1 biotin-dependent carboxyltransferase family protein [Dokdonella sp.]
MSVLVISPGLLSSVQDDGRQAWRHLGVGRSGALDAYSYSIANRLVGNATGLAAIEITLTGPRLHFEHAARVAICGAQIDADVDGLAIPCWRRVDLPAGSVLQLGACRLGARAYLAIAGGLDCEPLLGSRSTDLRAAFGGVAGRPLSAGDRLVVADGFRPDCSEPVIDARWVDPAPDLDLARPAIVHLLPGHDAITDDHALFATAWKVSAASNRQGLRLQGPGLTIADPQERISEPVMPGTLQLPADGQPILLLADAQTHGGYPRIAHAIRADLPRLAQLRPGDALRFVRCDAALAERKRIEQRQRLVRMSIALG